MQCIALPAACARLRRLYLRSELTSGSRHRGPAARPVACGDEYGFLHRPNSTGYFRRARCQSRSSIGLPGLSALQMVVPPDQAKSLETEIQVYAVYPLHQVKRSIGTKLLQRVINQLLAAGASSHASGHSGVSFRHARSMSTTAGLQTRFRASCWRIVS